MSATKSNFCIAARLTSGGKCEGKKEGSEKRSRFTKKEGSKAGYERYPFHWEENISKL